MLRKETTLGPADTLLHIPFGIFGIITVSLPLFSLVICFVTSVIFTFREVNETICGVSNFIPSISAITGISPQRYLWRVCIGLHSAPRLAVAVMYYNYYMKRRHTIVRGADDNLYRWLVRLNFWLSVVENMSLIGVTYISNVENYPIHEKIFIVFMITSCVYMFLTLIVYRMAHSNSHWTSTERRSFKMKLLLFLTIAVSTIGLLYFFYRHRFLCEPNAWSKFSLCEYVIVLANIGFHGTCIIDFSSFAVVSIEQSRVLRVQNGKIAGAD